MIELFVQPSKQVGLHHRDQQELPKKTPSQSRKKEASLSEASSTPKFRVITESAAKRKYKDH